jgi:hypothetical protein
MIPNFSYFGILQVQYVHIKNVMIVVWFGDIQICFFQVGFEYYLHKAKV